VPNNETNTIVLPRVAAANAKGATQRIQLYHNEDVNVSINGAAQNNVSAKDAIAPPPAGWNFRPCGELNVNKIDELVNLTMTRNDIELAGHSLITLTREADSWWATLQCQLDVKKGNLGTLKLRVPTTWIGPFDLESSHPATINVVSANEQTAVLAVRFAELIAAGGHLDLRIRGPVAVSLLAPVSMPQVTIDAQPNVLFFARVPNALESQPIAWTQLGVRPAPLPQVLQPATGGQESWSTFAIVENPFRLAFQPQAGSRPTPLIRLADTIVVNGPPEETLMLTRLILASHGLRACTLNVPTGQELVSATLDGQPALLRPNGPGNWQLTLGPAQLPQVVEIVSRSAPDRPDGDSTSLRRPSLESGGQQLPVEMSLYSIAERAASDRLRSKPVSSVTANDLATLRLDRMVSIAESATPLAAELAFPDNQNWFRSWASLLATVKRAAIDSSEETSQTTAESQVSRIADEQLQRAVEHLSEWLVKTEKFQQNPDPEFPAAALEASSPFFRLPILTRGADDWTYYVTDAGFDRSPIDEASMHDMADFQTAAALAVLLVIGGGSVWLTHSSAVRDLVCRWPNAVGVLVGIAYWAWLWPSWLGLVIAAACVLTSLRPVWPGRSMRTEASTVLRGAKQQS
jgi:hypothetical protein